MGNSIQSNVTKQIMSNYTKIVNETVMDVYNDAASTCQSGNMMNIETGGGQYCDFEIINGSININQTAGTNCKLDSTNVNNLSTNFTTQLINKTKQFIQQDAQNKQGWFATGFSLQISDATTVDQIMTQITNETKANFINKCSSVNTALNNGIAKLCGTYDGSSFNFNQNALITSITSCINQNVVDSWTNNSVLNNFWMQTDQKLASTQSGFSLKWLLIIIVILAIIGAIGGGIYYMSKNKKSGSTTSVKTTSVQ